FLKPLRESLAPTGFGHVESQESFRCQGVENPFADSPQRPQGIFRIKQVVEHFPQRRDRSARWHSKVNEGTDMELSFGNPLASHLDHGRGDVHTKDLIPRISEFFCPNPAATSEVYN